MNESQKNNQKYIEELEKFEETRKKWLKKDQRWEREKADIRELVSALREQAAQFKNKAPEEFELFYWTTRAHVIRDEIYNTSYAAVISILSLLISIFSMIYSIFSIINSIKQEVNVVAVFGLVSALIVILIIWIERRALFGGRERSYYRILYSILEDIRNKKSTNEER
ncbi:hypothetical protein [Enterocloster sp.]|uniref:hypothetical protein n=1 Tax=Enterocloster sp. TaxID=2719315 RepID=UPI003AEF4350